MLEVAITLRFNRVCLGAAKKKKHGHVVFCFDRDPVNRVMFMPAALSAGLRYAAKVANHHQAAVKHVDWCPIVQGVPRPDWRRTIAGPAAGNSRSYYAVHEAFPPGACVTLTAVLPDEILITDFEYLLTLVGKYRGFSPFNNDQEKYGTFEVISVVPVSEPRKQPHERAGSTPARID